MQPHEMQALIPDQTSAAAAKESAMLEIAPVQTDAREPTALLPDTVYIGSKLSGPSHLNTHRFGFFWCSGTNVVT
jgi:hypothetical protein